MNQQEKQKIINKLERWFKLLSMSGCNSKGIVRNDIQEMLKQLNYKSNKKYRFEFKSPYLQKHKHQFHYTNRLYLYLNEIKGRFTCYPENNLPLENSTTLLNSNLVKSHPCKLKTGLKLLSSKI